MDRLTLLALAAVVVLGTLIAFTEDSSTTASPRGDSAGEVRLVMFTSRGCPNCIAFHQQMEERYRSSSIGRKMPLVVRNARSGPGEYRLDYGIAYTPTFVVVKDGAEVSRFVGYQGRQAFMRQVTALSNEYAARGAPASPADESEGTPDAVPASAI